MNLHQALVFAILMENNDGILGKAPSYIIEKKDSVIRENPEVLLDIDNREKFNQWKMKWLGY